MFASLFLNFKVNFRKIISLDPPMKLERLADEVFFYQNMYFLHAKIIRRRRTIVSKTENFFGLTIYTYNIKIRNFFCGFIIFK
jgi:hypothetical protein